MRENKGQGYDHGAVGSLATGNGTSRHAGHFMAAIHVLGRSRRSFLMMMARNGAMISGTAGHTLCGPQRRAEGRIQQYDGQQAKAG
jgi:hypothetical protein